MNNTEKILIYQKGIDSPYVDEEFKILMRSKIDELGKVDVEQIYDEIPKTESVEQVTLPTDLPQEETKESDKSEAQAMIEGLKIALKYSEGSEKQDIKEMIKGLKISLKYL